MLCAEKDFKYVDQEAWENFLNSKAKGLVKLEKFKFMNTKIFKDFEEKGQILLNEKQKTRKQLHKILKKHSITEYYAEIMKTNEFPTFSTINMPINMVHLYKFIFF